MVAAMCRNATLKARRGSGASTARRSCIASFRRLPNVLVSMRDLSRSVSGLHVRVFTILGLLALSACGGSAPSRTESAANGSSSTTSSSSLSTSTSTEGSTVESVSVASSETSGPTTSLSAGGTVTSSTSVGSSGGPASSLQPTVSTVRPTATTVKVTPTTTKPATTSPPTAPPTAPPTVPPTAPPTTPAPTAPPRTIGSCQQVGLGTVNGWRVELGRAELGGSGSLYSGACSWATHLAELGGGGSHAPGVTGEVIYWSSSGCGSALSSWRNSSGHYAVLTANLATAGAIATVTDSNGRCWAVGRVA